MMTEWHLPPDYIVNNWTDELLSLMTEKLNERKEREEKQSEESYTGRHVSSHKVSDSELFRLAHKNIKVVKQ